MKNIFFTFSEIEYPRKNIEKFLVSKLIKEIHFFILGPEGTNTIQATKKWAKEKKINEKAKFTYCKTPEESIEKAKNIKNKAIFPIFTTCAVYYEMNKLFFSNPDCFVFMHHCYMKLDNMQLASKEHVKQIPDSWLIASHPSPSFLVSKLKNKIKLVDSNAEAAKKCSNGEVDACITTETSRKIYNLKTLHNFGCPTMLFCFGTTNHGIDILKNNL